MSLAVSAGRGLPETFFEMSEQVKDSLCSQAGLIRLRLDLFRFGTPQFAELVEAMSVLGDDVVEELGCLLEAFSSWTGFPACAFSDAAEDVVLDAAGLSGATDRLNDYMVSLDGYLFFAAVLYGEASALAERLRGNGSAEGAVYAEHIESDFMFVVTVRQEKLRQWLAAAFRSYRLVEEMYEMTVSAEAVG